MTCFSCRCKKGAGHETRTHDGVAMLLGWCSYEYEFSLVTLYCGSYSILILANYNHNHTKVKECFVHDIIIKQTVNQM